MLAGSAPIVFPSNQRRSDGKDCNLFSRRSGVLFVSVLEMLISLAGMTVYIYALALKPDWAPLLVPIPQDLCNAINIVHGVMYVIVLLCAMEMVLALSLFEAARREKRGGVRFWLSSMCTYLTLVTIVILGMDLGGIRCPTMNSAAFINIFLRFLEMIVVYAWVEQENLARKWRYARFSSRSRASQLNGVSTLTICSTVPEEDEEAATPPPSYSSTIPSTTVHLPPPPVYHPEDSTSPSELTQPPSTSATSQLISYTPQPSPIPSGGNGVNRREKEWQ